MALRDGEALQDNRVFVQVWEEWPWMGMPERTWLSRNLVHYVGIETVHKHVSHGDESTLHASAGVADDFGREEKVYGIIYVGGAGEKS